MEQSARAAASVVTADFGVLPMKLGELVAVLLSICSFDTTLELAKFCIAIHYVFDRRRFGRDQFLRNVCNRESIGTIEITRIRLSVAPNQRQQAGFSGAVRPGNADALASKERESRAFEE
jgi:hypothetical protein